MNTDESMLDVYIYETQQLLESLENTLFAGESEKKLDSDQINEVFRIMHTIKGSSSMMEFENMAKLSHSLEDMFSKIRDDGAPSAEWPKIFDIMFSAVSFFNGELAKLLNKAPLDGDATDILSTLSVELDALKAGGAAEPEGQSATVPEKQAVTEPEVEPAGIALRGDEPVYKVRLYFDENSQMENIRAFGVIQSLKKLSGSLVHVPDNLEGQEAAEAIVKNGFTIFIQTNENPDRIKEILNETLFLRNFTLLQVEGDDEEIPASLRQVRPPEAKETAKHEKTDQTAQDSALIESIAKQNFISVNVNKLDNLLNIVGEIVTAQSMVINNADFGDLPHDSFDSSAQQLHSLINELQDIVMSIRMIPISTLFQKMRRLVRDMGKKFDKDIELELIGEETEVDKNVIDYLSDPLLHIIRNSVDHGIEDAQTRVAAGKPARGKITLEARMTGSDVIVTVSDDGRGLQKEAILKKAYEKGLISKTDGELSDKEIFSLIFLPGFSTKDVVTEYSGRGVGMDVVRKNISQIGGSVNLESEEGKGTTHIIRIPLTLTIVDGMKFNVGKLNFIVPTVSVRSAVKPNPEDIFKDPEGHEMIMLLGECYSLVRLSKYFNIDDAVTDLSEGMIMHLASEDKEFCVFFDQLDGEYQVVVKSLPGYLQHCSSTLDGISGCAILGDGSINLILDVNGL